MNLIKSKNFKTFIAVFLLGYSFFFAGLSRVPVPTVDGAIRAAEARTIVQTGIWFPIIQDGKPVADHPPLYVWLTAASFKIFGVTDFGFNFAERIFAFLAVIAVFALTLEFGFSGGVALLASFVLCTTRDFTLSSVRGYIEPVLSTFIYFAVTFAFSAIRKKSVLDAFIAGVLIFLAAFSKGPPALWPFLFTAVLFFFNRPIFKARDAVFERMTENSVFEKLRLIASYLAGFAVCSAIFFIWMKKGGYEAYWNDYLVNQVFSSAVEGRGGAQRLEPFYFINILVTYYWPWLPFAALSGFIFMKSYFTKKSRTTVHAHSYYGFAMLVLAFGFIAGFSLVKWKFWYYIAPAYPALAVMIAIFIAENLSGIFSFVKKESFTKFITKYSLVWIAAVFILPVHLYLERAPEVMAMKEAALASKSESPVWFIHSLLDHNIIGSSGQWYFKRQVVKVRDDEEAAWVRSLPSPSLVFLWNKHWEYCNSSMAPAMMQEWCLKSRLVASHKESVLVEYTNEKKAKTVK